MFKAVSSPCLLCELKILAKPLPTHQFPSWQPTRSMAQVQSKVPSRMSLSPDVAKSYALSTADGKPSRRRVNGPFGGMNRTDAGNLPPKRTRKPFERSRATARNVTKTGKARHRDMKALKMQQALSRVSYGHRSTIKQRLLGVESFQEFNLLPSIHDSIYTRALRGLNEVVPTPIQRLAIPALLGNGSRNGRRALRREQSTKMEQFLMAAETGSGKTLAYLLPVMDAMKRAESFERDDTAKQLEIKNEIKIMNMWELEAPPPTMKTNPDQGRPRVIILQPTSELVDQVGAVVKAFSHEVKFRAALLSAAYSAKVIRNRLFVPSGVDIVVSTPYLLGNLAESDPNILSRVSHLIIDEADTLFDRGFAPLTSTIIDKATPSLKQLVMCSATIPRSLDSYLRGRFPEMQRLATPNLHAIPRRVQLSVVDIEQDHYQGNRDLACADTIWNIGQALESPVATNGNVKHIIVFVNEREKADELAQYLRGKSIDAVALNRDTLDQRHGELLSSFTSKDAARHSTVGNVAETVETFAKPVASPTTPQPRHAQTNAKVLVMTDLGSRGIDTVAVRNVILYDVPHSTIDFIHRLGRTGRMGRRGRGFVLVGKGDRKDIVREVREGMFKGQALI